MIRSTRGPAATGGRGAELSAWDAVRLVTGREITVRLRDRTFLLGTLFFLVFVAAVTFLPVLFASESDPSTVAVAQAEPAAKLRAAGLTVRQVADDAAAERLVRVGDVDAAVVAGEGGSGVAVLAMDDAPNEVLDALSEPPAVRLLDADALSPELRYLVPTVMGMVFLMTSLTFGVQIAQSVTEEKQTRIVEILVAAVPVRALLTGKVLGGSALALGQITLLTAVSLIGARATGSPELLSVLVPAISWFVPFFIVGFAMIAVLWAAAGALVNRQEDLAGASGPLQILLVLPFLAVFLFRDNPVAMTVLSYVPFSAPMAMPVRLFSDTAAAWEPFVALVVLVGSAAVLMSLAARVYERSLLRMTGRVALRTAWRDRSVAVPR